MKRGELYRVARPHPREPKRFRVFVVVSRQALIDSRFSTMAQLTRYVGSLGPAKLQRLDTALMAALGIEPAGRKGRWLLHDGDS